MRYETQSKIKPSSFFRQQNDTTGSCGVHPAKDKVFSGLVPNSELALQLSCTVPV